MESRRPRTERSALALTDLPRDPEALTDQQAAVRGGEVPLGYYDGWASGWVSCVEAHERRSGATKKGDPGACRALETEQAVELLPLTVPEVRRLLCDIVWRSVASTEQRLHWSWWRRRHQARAKRCHYRRRLARPERDLRL